LKKVEKGEGLLLDPERIEYNSGLWSVPFEAFQTLVKEYAGLSAKYYLNATLVKPITDQIFLAPAAVKAGLRPYMLAGKFKTYAYTACKHYDIGLNHIAGGWRSRKAAWQAKLKTSGIEAKLRDLTRIHLTEEEYQWLWKPEWDRDRFLGNADLPFRGRLQRKLHAVHHAIADKFKAAVKAILNKRGYDQQ
jgi:hypothetical protein